MPIRILLLDEETLVREALRCLLKSLLNAQVGEAPNLEEARAVAQRLRPHVVVVTGSLRQSSVYAVIKDFRSQAENCNVLVLGGRDEGLFSGRMIAAGATGFVSKLVSAGEFVKAVTSVAEGRPYVDQATDTPLTSEAQRHSEALKQLTLRQAEILRALGQGQALSAIAKSMGISYKTVANTCVIIKNKFGLKQTADLRRLAIQLGRV